MQGWFKDEILRCAVHTMHSECSLLFLVYIVSLLGICVQFSEPDVPKSCFTATSFVLEQTN